MQSWTWWEKSRWRSARTCETSASGAVASRSPPRPLQSHQWLNFGLPCSREPGYFSGSGKVWPRREMPLPPAPWPTGTPHADFGRPSPDRPFKPTGRRLPSSRLPIPMDALARRAAVSLPTCFWLLADWCLERATAHSPSPATPVHAGNAGRNDGDGCNASLTSERPASPP